MISLVCEKKFSPDRSRAFCALIGLALGISVSGCFLVGAKIEAMIPEQAAVRKKNPHSVSLQVKGGQETSKLDQSRISNEAFTEALRAALVKSQMFSEIQSREGSEYQLEVLIHNVDQPFIALNATVVILTTWQLTDLETTKKIWKETFSTSHTATVGDALYGITRLRLATEGAAKENIKEGIKRLSSANF